MSIDEMPAGREMDGQIHVLVFNKAVPTDHDWLHDTFCDCVPRYSTDIVAAWAVVEKLRAGGIYFTIRTDIIWDVTLWDGNEGTWNAGGCQDKWLVDVQAKTAPLAICRAALKAASNKNR